MADAPIKSLPHACGDAAETADAAAEKNRRQRHYEVVCELPDLLPISSAEIDTLMQLIGDDLAGIVDSALGDALRNEDESRPVPPGVDRTSS